MAAAAAAAAATDTFYWTAADIASRFERLDVQPLPLPCDDWPFFAWVFEQKCKALAQAETERARRMALAKDTPQPQQQPSIIMEERQLLRYILPFASNAVDLSKATRHPFTFPHRPLVTGPMQCVWTSLRMPAGREPWPSDVRQCAFCPAVGVHYMVARRTTILCDAYRSRADTLAELQEMYWCLSCRRWACRACSSWVMKVTNDNDVVTADICKGCIADTFCFDCRRSHELLEQAFCKKHDPSRCAGCHTRKPFVEGRPLSPPPPPLHADPPERPEEITGVKRSRSPEF